jgi:putative tryptophan/tyrosine transport system substrate-binding protein
MADRTKAQSQVISPWSRSAACQRGHGVERKNTLTRPRLRRVAVLVNSYYRAAVLETSYVEVTAQTVGCAIIRAEIPRVDAIAPAIEAVKGRADALYVCTNSFANSNRALINTKALAARLSTMQGIRESAIAGGLMSYGANFPELFRRAGAFVDTILRGAKPGELPVEQPTTFALVINLKTAKALGLTIPQSLLLRADEVIQ